MLYFWGINLFLSVLIVLDMSNQREQVFATRMTLQTYKGKHKGAVVGFELLKKKQMR